LGKPKTLSVFAQKKRRGEKIVLLTAYDLTSALIARDGGVDAILVGDSLGMVVMGYDTTLPVTIDDMVHHCRSVGRARPDVPVIADMPYGSFHVSAERTLCHALRLVKEGGVSGVKIEGGRKREAVIKALLIAEIPVMGHLGLTPQSIHKFGGYKVQGRGRGAADLMVDEAEFLEEVGCFSLVLECIPAELARRISQAVNIPTIGIGAGPDCDGQVLVYYDMLGLFQGLNPRFVKRYAELGEQAVTAVRRYCEEVRQGVFPGSEHIYSANGKLQGRSGVAEPSATEPSAAEPVPAGQPPPTKGYLASCENDHEGS
jgi:3-methyl-2-oxobutanoate hydroxymethyltransferase